MSRNQFLEFLAYISPVFLGTALLFFPNGEDPTAERTPQSLVGTPKVLYPGKNINYQKLKQIASQRNLQNVAMKVKGHMQVSVELLDNFEEDAPFRLKALVTSKVPVDYADVKWTLGPGVEMLTGSEENVLYNLNAKTPAEDEVTLQKTPDGLPARVFFQVSYEKDGKVFAQTGYYSSKHQTTVITGSSKKVLSTQPQNTGGLKVIY